MGTYKVLIIENICRARTEIVEANNYDEAEEFVHQEYDDGRYNDGGWNIADDGGVEFIVEGDEPAISLM